MHATVLLCESVKKDKYQLLNKFQHSSLMTDCERKVFQTNVSVQVR